MFRLLFIAAVALVILQFGAGDLSAADPGDWPGVDIQKDFRGPGHYLGLAKVLACWVLFAVWVYSTDWVSSDARELKLNYTRWSPIVFGVFVGGFILVWLLPVSFWVVYPLLVIAYLAPLIGYIVSRNSQVLNDQRVFTKEHIRHWVAHKVSKIGIKMEAQTLDPHEKGPPVKLSARGAADPRQDGANLLAARQHPGLLHARTVIADGLSYRASAIMLEYTQQGVGVRVMVDGVWLPRESIDRETGDPALESMKVLCGLNAQDRQGRQNGKFAAEFESVNYMATMACQGTKTGERAMIQFEDKNIHFDSLDDLGMRTKIQEQVKELLDLESGLLLFSAMPAAGLRSSADVILRQTDRFMREFMAVEEKTKRYEEVENCPVTTYDAAAGQSPADVLVQVFRQEPNAVIVRDLVNGETVSMICREVAENRLFLSTVRAKDSAEALLRVLAMGVEPDEFAPVAKAVLNQRLVRKLCDACKEAYTPTPQILKQLGIPEGRIQAFYRPPQQPEEVCEECVGIGYKGRTAIFELLVVGETVRKVLTTSPKLDLLRKAARKDGMRSLQEEGILLVAKGVTSLPELMRVLKQ